jgi:hypothetical protein
MARYRLTERAYIADRVLEPGTEIGSGTEIPFDGTPGPYMEPLDTAAKAEVAKAAKHWGPRDPLATLPLTGS